MLTFVVTFETENAAFGESRQERLSETARVLREVAKRVESEPDGRIRDVSGNTIGVFQFINH